MLLALSLVSPALTTAQAVTQPALKAAFLYNFAKFVEWPGDSSPSGPLTLCVLDDAAVEDALAQLVNGTAVNGRGVALMRGMRNRSLRICHLVYVSDSDATRATATLDDFKGAPILTVGDGEEFTRSGGMIGLIVEDGRMRFSINPDAAQRAGLKLSSKLLSLAKIVKDGRNGRS
jgi:hypothetical protein